MLTEKQIFHRAKQYADENTQTMYTRDDFQAGATWANEQNAQEIAELVAVLKDVRAADIVKKIDTGGFFLPKSLREKMQSAIEKHEK